MTAPVAVVFDSGYGHTSALAESIGLGLSDAGAQMRLAALADGPADLDALSDCAAIIFGAPTYMGGVSHRFKAFMDASSGHWEARRWRNKIAGGFTVGARTSGDKLATLQHLAIFAAQHGMIWVGQESIGSGGAERGLNADGSWLGLMATQSNETSADMPEADLQTARDFGQRIAWATARWGQ